jgi:deoxyribodipyrimidine photo-lyase
LRNGERAPRVLPRMTSILWFRQDLRLRDQPALAAAVREGAVIPVYVLDDEAPGEWRIGGAQRWWLHGSLASLAASLEALGSRLILRRGRAAEVLPRLLEETGADGVHAVKHYEPWWAEAEQALGERLRRHDGNHLIAVEGARTGSGKPYRIFSSFWKAIGPTLPPPAPLPAPDAIPAPDAWPESDRLEDWALLPTKPDWAGGFRETWTPGEAEALAVADRFAARVGAYETARNLPSEPGTSVLSPHLHFGEVSPAEVWHRARLVNGGADVEKFGKELAWRDFTSGVISALPDYAEVEGRARYAAFPWRTGVEAARDLKRWRRGRTGYPIVDAGMRQLWHTGWMHNRVRMIAASFLVKHLLIDWREGERWFWDTLVDADFGNNAVNWQWIAGTGIDANVFTRIMAPLVQSEKFAAGDYIRRWVPELREIGGEAIHDPEAAGVRPAGYPAPMIGHREARARALAAHRAFAAATRT